MSLDIKPDMACSFLRAVEDCRYVQARILLKHGVDINGCSKYGEYPLLIALKMEDKIKKDRMFRWLLKRGCNPYFVDINNGRDIILWAAYLNSEEQIHFIMAKWGDDIDIQRQDKNGRTVFHYSTAHNNIPAVLLFAKHADKYDLTVDKRDVKGLTPYAIAKILGHVECAEILSKVGKSVKVQIHYSCFNPAAFKSSLFDDEIYTKNSSPNLQKRYLTKSAFPAIRASQKTSPSYAVNSIYRSKSCVYSDNLPTMNKSVAESSTKRKSHHQVALLLNLLAAQNGEAYLPAAKAVAPRHNPSSISFTTAATVATLVVSSRKRRKIRHQKNK